MHLHISVLAYRQMLKKPRSQYIRRYLRKYASFLLILLAVGVVILLARAVPAADARVARITCKQKKTAGFIAVRT